MQCEVSASAERHASVFQPDHCRYTGNSGLNRKQALRVRIRICAALSNMHHPRHSTAEKTPCAYVHR